MQQCKNHGLPVYGNTDAIKMRLVKAFLENPDTQAIIEYYFTSPSLRI